jgi:hypothetical protein
MKGINGQPVVDMSRFIDFEKFKSLQPDILAGIAESKHLAFEGIWCKIEPHPNSTNPQDWKTIPDGLKEFLNDTTIAKDSKAMQWYNDLGNISSRNKFSRFLKLKYGVYDPIFTFYLTTNVNYGGETMPEADMPNIADYFPSVMEWANSLVGTVFTEITQIVIVYMEQDGKTLEHQDVAPDEDLSIPLNKVHTDINDTPNFIHMRLDTNRSFYISDPENKNKHFANSWACWFNSKDWHSIGRHLSPNYSLRFDGPFTDAVRKELNL